MTAGYMNKQTITPGVYWARVGERTEDEVVQVSGEAPGLEVRRLSGLYASFADVQFVCRVPTSEQITSSQRFGFCKPVNAA